MTDDRLKHEIEHGKVLSKAGAGDVWNWDSPAGKLRWQRRVKMLTSHLQADMKVLELGCGTGYFTKEAAKSGAAISAIDISAELLEQAKIEVPLENVEFMLENAYDMGFDDNSFDAVIGSSVLHHLEIDKALKEIFRVLRPGGTLHFTEPNMLNPQIALQKNIPFLKKMLGDSPDETAFFAWSLKKKMLKYGFSAVNIKAFDFLHPAIPGFMLPIMLPFCSALEKIPIFSSIAGSLFISATRP
ncbi:MAG: class I SAM-dependent methyltransferase [Victivallales bacterium]|nr:class I SAM-dependent methyltransferase [Victivallales bacterium]